jgi:hypothetical protein
LQSPLEPVGLLVNILAKSLYNLRVRMPQAAGYESQ